MQRDPHLQYVHESEKQKALLQQLTQKRRRLSLLRFAVFVITAFVAYKIFAAYGLLGFVPLVFGLSLLLYLVSLDGNNNESIRNTKTLAQINEEELEALAYRFHHRDDGERFLPKEHPFAGDLDLFGPASIFQWLNRSYSEQGQALVAQNLLQAQPSETVLLRQEAVKDLAPLLSWRQQAQAYIMQKKMTLATEKRIHNWTTDEEKHFHHPAWRFGVAAYHILTLSSLVGVIAGLIPVSIFSTLYTSFLVVSLLLSRSTLKAYAHLNGVVKEVAALQNFLAWLEKPTFQTKHLRAIQGNLTSGALPASHAVKKLRRVLDRFDLRISVGGILFLNPFLLWDVRQMMALNDWRKKFAPRLSFWFEALAEIELLNSLSTLHFNQPRWCFPAFSANHFTLQGQAIGHPLIADAHRVTNDFSLEGQAKIDLITGSNMAGKSTFLRSLGVNLLLAQMGAPVCAKVFTLSPVQLMSSMRIADNLAENTSTFYAELKKLRTIIEAVKTHESLFVLLDEILRGTNSFDRHKGSAAFIQQLIKEKAVAVIATHDVELAQLRDRYPSSVTNYHFDVEVEGEELYFDYKLKPGVCQSLNASLLMKKIGIEITE